MIVPSVPRHTQLAPCTPVRLGASYRFSRLRDSITATSQVVGAERKQSFSSRYSGRSGEGSCRTIELDGIRGNIERSRKARETVSCIMHCSSKILSTFHVGRVLAAQRSGSRGFRIDQDASTSVTVQASGTSLPSTSTWYTVTLPWLSLLSPNTSFSSVIRSF